MQTTEAPAGSRTRRLLLYLLGLLILCFGLTLNNKSGLGNSPIIAVAYAAAELLDIPIGITSFVWYTFFVFLQFLFLRKRFALTRLLQVITSVLCSTFVQTFAVLLPSPEALAARIAMLFSAIICVGIGASITVGMRFPPNTADAFSSCLGEALHRDFGFGKNIVDITCVLITAALTFLVAGHVFGIGIGTLCAMIFVGRVIALFQPVTNRLYHWACH